ncbi:MAG: molybdopterin-guanine dinucleotide biosynthesis protein B [Desulfurobacteriaceae bacterium]
MVSVVSFIGYHNSGKTTFVKEVVKILKEKGYRIAVLKSTKHENVIKDTEGKDSYKYKEAGANAIGIITPSELILFKKLEDFDLETLASKLFSDYDIVICEGFKKSKVPKFEITRKDIKEPLLVKNLENVIGVISDYEVDIDGVLKFPLDNPQKVATFLEEKFIKDRNEKVELFVNGNKIPLKPFIRSMLKEILFGFIRPLKGIEETVKSLDVRIRRK